MKRWKACFVLLAGAIGAISLGQSGNAAGDAKQAKWYVRPVTADPSSRRALDDAGIQWVEFEYCLPGDSKAAFTFVATDDKGEIIKPLSTVTELFTTDDEHKGLVRLTCINPSGSTESATGKFGWVRSIGRTKGKPIWHQKFTGNFTWRDGKTVESPELDVDYPLWEVWAHPTDLKEVYEDSPRTFEFKISFQIEKLAPGERRRTSVRWRDVEPRPKKK